MVAGSQYRGQFEQRLKTASQEAADERDAALARRFSPVLVEEPSVEDTVEILRGLRADYEHHHGCAVDDAALEAAARLSDRYMTENQLPDKAVDLVDKAAARVRLRRGGGDLAALEAQKDEAAAAEDYERAAELKTRIDAVTAAGAGRAPTAVGEQDVADVVAQRTGIPVGRLVAGELERLRDLDARLHERVVGQERAVETVAETIRRARVGLAESDRPLGTFLFLGPTGVGKTELVKALAERLFATEKALVRIDMSEFREPHTVARLIGSPPGYVGYGDGGQFTEPVRRRPYSVVLLDEIGKASDVWDSRWSGSAASWSGRSPGVCARSAAGARRPARPGARQRRRRHRARHGAGGRRRLAGFAPRRGKSRSCAPR